MRGVGRIWPWLAAWALCLAWAWATLLPVLGAGKVAAIGDGLAQDWPMRLLVAREWRAGHWPVWNPFQFGGAPLWAAIQPGPLFPGNWPFLVLGPVAAWHWALAWAYASAGLGAIALGRALGLPWAAACFGGLAFEASGFMLGHLENLVMIQAAAGLPWVLAAIAWLRPAEAWAQRWAPLALLALAGGLTLLAGHPQMAIFTALWGAAFALACLLGLPAPQRAPFLGALGLGGLLGLGLGAPAWLPAALWLPHTSRAHIPYAQLAFRALPPRQLLALWLPLAFGAPATPGLPPYWGGPAFAELQGYASLGAWGLAAWALAPGRRRVALALAAMAGVSLLLALGPATPLFRLWAALPLLQSLPVPGRHLLPLDLALSTLAALGLARLLVAPLAGPWRWAPLVALGAVPLGAWLGLLLAGPQLVARWAPYLPGLPLAEALRPGAWPWLSGLALALAWGALLGARRQGRASRPWQGALAALLLLDLGQAAWAQGWAQRAAPGDFLAGPWPSPPREGRVLARSVQRPYPFDAPGALQALAYPGWGAWAGVPALQGYDAFVGRRFARLAGGMQGAGEARLGELLAPGHRLLDLAGVQRLWFELGAEAPWRAQLQAPRWRPQAPALGRLSWANAQAFPRAWRVAAVADWPASEVDAAVLGQRAWAPRDLALVDTEEGPAPAEAWRTGPARASFPVGGAFWVESEGPGAGFVLLGEAWHPGWHAEAWPLSGGLVGGLRAEAGPGPARPLALRRANGWQLGLVLPPGAWRVRLAYWPPGLSLALALAWALLAVLGIGVLLWRRVGILVAKYLT